MIGLDEMNEHKRRWAEHEQLVEKLETRLIIVSAAAFAGFVLGMASGLVVLAGAAMGVFGANVWLHVSAVDKSAKHAMEQLGIRGQR